MPTTELLAPTEIRAAGRRDGEAGGGVKVGGEASGSHQSRYRSMANSYRTPCTFWVAAPTTVRPAIGAGLNPKLLSPFRNRQADCS